MLNNKMWIALIVGLIAGSLTFGAYKTGAISRSVGEPVSYQEDKNSSEINENAGQEKEKVEEADLERLDNVTPNTKTITNSPVSQQDHLVIDNAIKSLIGGGNFVEAKENTIYSQGKGIIVDKKIVVALEGYRIIVDESSYSTGKYYAVMDITIFNISNSDYISSPLNFILSDSNGYTYTPVIGANTRGDISGALKIKDSRRGEIAFYVPVNETKLELRFNTGNDAVKSIRFAVDTDSLVNPPLPK